MSLDLNRRQLVRAGLAGLALVLARCGGVGGPRSAASSIPNEGDLAPPDANGVMLLPGYTSRVVARSGEAPVAGGAIWHGAPDGGATFATSDGGWIYVSNSEIGADAGGAAALRFDAQGTVLDAYPILSGTNRNCSGGRTPWGTWLSCEEDGDVGQVYECDPFGVTPAAVRPALGSFNHEAAAVDPAGGHLYLTEDRVDGGFYRFVPDLPFPDLSTGTLQVAQVAAGSVAWHDVPDPQGTTVPTRFQVGEMTPFDGGEGIDHYAGRIYFSTKGDNHIWCYDVVTQEIEVLYDGTSGLTGVDNLTLSPAGDVVVAEDGGNLQIVAIAPDGSLSVICQLVGHDDSELAGIAFSPDFTRLYFSSQRGTTGTTGGGMTFEIAGPFGG